MYPNQPRRSPFLDEAARLLREREGLVRKVGSNVRYPDDLASALEPLTKAWMDLAAIEQGNLTPEVSADLVAAALKRLGANAT